MMRKTTLAWSFIVVEYERWGSKPDGFVSFATKELAEAAWRKMLSERTGPVPDCYDDWQVLQERPVSDVVAQRIAGAGGQPVYHD
jgi:hypothetical protein